jgi:hypothetical protein
MKFFSFQSIQEGDTAYLNTNSAVLQEDIKHTCICILIPLFYRKLTKLICILIPLFYRKMTKHICILIPLFGVTDLVFTIMAIFLDDKYLYPEMLFNSCQVIWHVSFYWTLIIHFEYPLIDFLFVYCLMSRSRIFHLYGDVLNIQIYLSCLNFQNLKKES